MEYSGHSHGDSGFVGDRLKLTGAGGGGEAGAQSSGGSGSAAETAAAIKETGVTTHRDPQSWRSVMMTVIMRVMIIMMPGGIWCWASSSGRGTASGGWRTPPASCSSRSSLTSTSPPPTCSADSSWSLPRWDNKRTLNILTSHCLAVFTDS